MIVAMIHPLRGSFVDLVDRSSRAPLEWIFDGLYNVGQAAVPINMLILGCNLSNSYNQYSGKAGKTTSKAGLFSTRTMVGIVLGKMVVLPLVGIVSTILLRLFVLDIPEGMTASFYLVMMIVFLTVRMMSPHCHLLPSLKLFLSALTLDLRPFSTDLSSFLLNKQPTGKLPRL